MKIPQIFPDKNPLVSIHTGGLIRNSYKKPDISAKNVQAKVRFKSNSFDSINISEIEFSNMLDDKILIPPRTRSAINKLVKNPDIININSKSINTYNDHDNRMRKILEHYISNEEFDTFCDDFRKSELKDENIVYDEHGDFRVITLFSVEKENDKDFQQYLTVILLDLYHLFLPSKHRGKSKEESKKANYNAVRHFSHHIKEHFFLN